MDADDLREEVDAWVSEELISQRQAEAILARYEPDESGRSRAVLALSLVGVALVFVGLTLFLATNWSDLPRVFQLFVLLAGPGLAYAGGVVAYRREVPRVGHALCLLGAVLVAPSLFLLEDVFAVAIAEAWLLFAWTTIALTTGHALESRPGTGLGIVALLALVVELVEPTDPAFAVGALGVVLFTLGHARDDRPAWTYRVGGVAITLGVLVLLTTVERRFSQFALEPTGVLVVVLGAALAGAGWLAYSDDRAASGWAVSAILALSISVGLASLAPETIPALAAFLGVYAAALVGLLASGYLGYRRRDRALIDLATVGALALTLSFVAATVVGTLSGAIALVVAGLVLLAAGVTLERGRRSLVARL